MNELKWTDQPKFLEGGSTLFHAFLREQAVEVRDVPNKGIYVTLGNLYGSQTIECGSYGVAFTILNAIANAKEGQKLMCPPGAKVIPENGSDE